MADKKLTPEEAWRIDLHKLNCPWCRQRGAPDPLPARPGDKLESGEGEPQYVWPTYSLSRDEAERMFPVDRETMLGDNQTAMDVLELQRAGRMPAADDDDPIRALDRRDAEHRRAVADFLTKVEKHLAMLPEEKATAVRRAVIMGVDMAQPGSDQTVAYVPMWTEEEVEEVIRESEPLQVMTVELFDGRVFHVAGEYQGEDWKPGDLGDRARRVVRQAQDCYTEAELQDVLKEPGAKLTTVSIETWERGRFEALPEEYGHGRIADKVWPADALRIRGACPRTNGHHKLDTRGRYCTACGREARE